jgi:hypothetical protein
MAQFNIFKLLTIGDNNFSKLFRKTDDKEEVKRNSEELTNSQGISEEQIEAARLAARLGISSDVHANFIDFEPYLRGKRTKIGKYREMSLYAEVADAIDVITNDAIVEDAEGEIVTLKINKDKLPGQKLPEAIDKRMRAAFQYLQEDILRFNEKGEDYFRKWLVEAELFQEIVPSKDGKNIVGIRVLPAWTMIPIYVNGKISHFYQMLTSDITLDHILKGDFKEGVDVRRFEKNQVVYVNYGLYGDSLLDVRGYLEAAIRTYNQLRNLEDAIVVYRLVRAPERRVWNIYTGRLTKGKAEEYIKGLIRRYKKKNIYDPATGMIDSQQNVQAITQDFWFSKDESGNGTSVDTIGGGMNLGEIEDLNYFLQKFYKTLKLPSSRWMNPGENTWNSGRSGEITREEIKFARFIQNLRKRFKYMILGPFIQLCRMRGIDDIYLKRGVIDVEFNESNLWKEFKELEILEARFGMFSNADSYVYDPENNPTGYFSREYALRNFFRMNDEEYNENKKLLDQEKKKDPPEEDGAAALSWK